MHIVETGKRIARFVKIEHTLFSLPLIFAGSFLASTQMISLSLVLLMLLAAVGARTVALTLNRIIDRKIDFKNPRTRNRELPSGALTMVHAVVILFVGLLLYFVSAAMISTFCLYLSPIPLIIFTLYPYMKRFTPLAHFGVGAGLSMAPLGGWFAVKGSFDDIIPGALLSLFVFFWATGFDIIYSTLDEAFDKKENLYSFVSRYGKKRALQISSFLHVISFIVLTILFVIKLHGLVTFTLLLLAGYLLFLEHRKVDDVDLAFFKINILTGFVVLLMVVTGVNAL